jgi:hypothetical protein
MQFLLQVNIALNFIVSFLGGAIANLYAMNAARHSLYPRVKSLGMGSVKTLCCFTSENVSVCSILTYFSYLLESLFNQRIRRNFGHR